MKRTVIFLLTIIALTYGYQGYKACKTYIEADVTIKTSGRLSDISDGIVSVPLETPDSGVIRKVSRVQKDGDDLFLLSDGRLLLFDLSGRFIRQIADDPTALNQAFIADYTLDTERRRIVVVDSRRHLRMYHYDGRPIAQEKMLQPWRKLTALAYHDGYLWLTAERLEKKNNDTDSLCQIAHNLYQLDDRMNILAEYQLRTADVGRDVSFNTLLVDELLADEYGVYAYTTPVDMRHLHNDTLHILQCEQLPALRAGNRFGKACIYPVRKGKRFFMSTSYQAVDNCYTYCYDFSRHTAYILPEGFRDDVYRTGQATNLQPMDMYNRTYCFLKSGAELAKKFPERAANSDQPVLFIVNLKS
jgi:hypothetical protein